MTSLIQKYLEYLRYEKNYSSHTEISYSVDLMQFQSFVEKKNLELDLIDADLLRQWIVELMGLGLSPRSVNRKLSAVKSLFSYLLRKQIITKNKLAHVVGPKVSQKIPSFVNNADLNDLLSAVNFDESFNSLRTRAILEMFYMTGIRRAELISLKDADVDMESGQIKVTGKRNKQRVIPIHSRLISILKLYKQARIDEVKGSVLHFFVRETGEALYPMLVHRIVTDCLQQLTTLSKTSPHVLRHSFATAMLNNGADINAIKELLGHASLAATEIYTHTSLEELKKVYNQAHPRA